MLLKVQAEDGQDFAIQCGEQTGHIAIAVWDCNKGQTDMEPFTIEEAKAAVALLQFAISIAEEEREEMEARNGH